MLTGGLTVAFFRSSFVSVIAAAGTTLLSLSFVFAVTTQEFLGSCIFLFVKHPYDVGDRVDITGIPMMVDRISLLYTVFTRLEQMQVVQVRLHGVIPAALSNGAMALRHQEGLARQLAAR